MFCKIHVPLALLFDEANCIKKCWFSNDSGIFTCVRVLCLQKYSWILCRWELGLTCSFTLHFGQLNLVFLISLVLMKNTTQNSLSFQGSLYVVLRFKTGKKPNCRVQDRLTHEAIIHRNKYIQQNEGSMPLVPYYAYQFAKDWILLLSCCIQTRYMNSCGYPVKGRKQCDEIGQYTHAQCAPDLVAQYTVPDFQNKKLQEQIYKGKVNKCKKVIN